MNRTALRLAPVLLALLPALAHAATAPPPGYQPLPDPPPQRMSSLVVYGNDPCPPSTSGEIVVCAREPENERYRVPKRFRDQKKALPAQTSWAANARMLDSVARQGTPNTCSPVGSGGQSGCQAQFLAQARAQREADREAAAADAP